MTNASMENQPELDLRRYALAYRLYFVAFAVSTAPFTIEAIHNYNQAPERFLGDLWFGPFWIVWGTIATLACLAAAMLDTIRTHGLAVSFTGVFCLGRILLNIFDRDDSERWYTVATWSAWLLVVMIVAHNVAWARPRVIHLYVFHRNRLAAYRAAKAQLDEQDREARRAQATNEPDER